MVKTMKMYDALVENPYYLKYYDGAFGFDSSILDIAVKQNQKEYVELLIVLEQDGIFRPYFDRPTMTNFFFGSRIKEIRDHVW